MKKSFKIISALILSSTMAFGLGATVFASSRNAKKTEAYYSPSTHYEVSDTASELASYYSTITDSMSGSTLLSELQSLNASKRKKTIGYSAMGTSASSSCYVYTDYDPNYTTTDSNGQTYGTKVLSFYTKTSSTEWNREHVWPNSHGGGSKGSSTGTLVDSDVYMPRPTISSENSSRGNSYYVEGLNSDKNGWDPKTAGYEEWVRGECARIILYCVVANTSLTLNNNTSSGTPDAAMGKMETLIKWHYAYSPSEYEINRNNGGQYLQGNRNPFVDHPEYVSRIWGVSSGPTGASSTIASQVNNASSTYDSWVAGSGSTYGTNDAVGGTTGNSVTISSSGKTMTVGDTDTLYATSSDSSNITWTTSNSSVCSLNKTTTGSGSSNTVTLTAVAAGTATITAKATIGGNVYQKTCAVTVNAAGSQNNATAGTIVPGDLATAYETNSSGTAHTSSDGNIGFKTYQCANYSSKIQWKKSTNAFLYSTTSLNLSTIKINGASGGTLTVYGDNTAGGTSNTITGSNGTYDLSGYKYFYIKNASSSAAMATSIEVSTASAQTASITLDKSSASVAVNGTVNLTATATGGTGNVTWSTSNSSIAQLSTTSGTSVTVTGKAAGTATITASYSGKTATCAVTVTSSTPTVNSVTVSPSTLSLNLNGTNTGTLTATVSVSNGAAQTVNWSSSNSSIASVSSSGVVTGVAAGTATITATSTVDSTKKGTCTVTVTSGSSTQPQHAGTEADPYTTADAKLVMDNTGSGVVYQTEVYVTMVPTSSSFNSSYSQYTCTDSNMEISSASLGFTPKGTYTETDALVGKTVVAKGYIELYNGVYKMGYLPASVSPTGSKYNPSIVSITPDTSSGEQSEGVYTLAPATGSNSSYAGDCDVTIDNVSWNVVGNATMIPWRLGGKSISNTDRTVTSKNAVSSQNISSVVLTVGNADSITVNSLTLKVGTTEGASDVSSVAATFSANSDITFERPSGKDWSNCYFTFVFNVTVSGSSNKFVQFTKAVFYADSSTDGAATFAQEFMNAFTCDATGTNTPTFASGKSWASLKTAFNALSTTDQNTLKNATANESGTDIEKAVARYDYVVSKYGYENFMDRTIANSANKMNVFNGNSTNNILLILGSVSLLGGLTYLAYFLKKRKED